MKLAVSNIAWTSELDSVAYEIMGECGFSGLEIAPTRVFPKDPYDRLSDAQNWAEELKREYGFCVPSIQSIWYGRQERIFGSNEEFNILLNYTKKAIDFARTVECNNLVFGCPRNRELTNENDSSKGIDFFRLVGDYAISKGTVIGMEANPTIYNTNYINDTASALSLIKQVDSKGFKLNLDVGTMIHNGESVKVIEDNIELINHVHISEPGLKPLEERKLHSELVEILLSKGYQGFISIEMGRVDDIKILKEKMRYLRGIINL